MTVMAQDNIDFIRSTVAQVQAQSMNQGFTLNYSGPAGDFAEAFGLGNRRPAVPMGINDCGRIGSTTKSFLGWLIMREIDRATPIPGTLPVRPFTLDATLNNFVSGVPRSDQITIRDMMTMRSGVYDYQSDSMLRTRFAVNHVSSFTEAADALSLIRSKTSGAAIGTTFEYTNSNYVLLAEVLRVLTGRDWRDLIQNDILTPLGMTQTKIPGHQDWMLPNPWMHGFGVHTIPLFSFIKDDDQSAWNPDMFGAAGALISTAGDLAKWGQARASGWGLSPATNDLVNTFYHWYPWPHGEGVTQYGYGLASFGIGEWRGHDGSVPGYSAQCMYHPPTGAVIAGLENYQSADVAIFSRVFVRTARKLYPGSI